MIESLKVQCPVPLKALMTEQLREELLSSETLNLGEVERQLEMLSQFAVTQEDVFERQRRLQVQLGEVEGRIARVREAPEGGEFLLRVVPALVELRVGDNFLEKMSTEILLENGVIVALSVATRTVGDDEESDQAPS